MIEQWDYKQAQKRSKKKSWQYLLSTYILLLTLVYGFQYIAFHVGSIQELLSSINLKKKNIKRIYYLLTLYFHYDVKRDPCSGVGRVYIFTVNCIYGTVKHQLVPTHIILTYLLIWKQNFARNLLLDFIIGNRGNQQSPYFSGHAVTR